MFKRNYFCWRLKIEREAPSRLSVFIFSFAIRSPRLLQFDWRRSPATAILRSYYSPMRHASIIPLSRLLGCNTHSISSTLLVFKTYRKLFVRFENFPVCYAFCSAYSKRPSIAPCLKRVFSSVSLTDRGSHFQRAKQKPLIGLFSLSRQYVFLDTNVFFSLSKPAVGPIYSAYKPTMYCIVQFVYGLVAYAVCIPKMSFILWRNDRWTCTAF